MSHFDEQQPINGKIKELWEKAGLGFNDHSIPPAVIVKYTELVIGEIFELMGRSGNEKSIIAKADIREAFNYYQHKELK